MAGSLESVLAGIPGYAGYIAKQKYDEERQSGELAQAHTLQSIISSIQQGELMKQLGGSMAGGAPAGTPEQLDALAVKLGVAGHPGAAAISTLADKRRKTLADAATLKTIQSPAPAPVQSAPDPEGLKMVANTGETPTTIPGTNFTNPTAEQVPAEDRPAFDKVLNEARAKNAATRGEGGLFATLMQSEIPLIANQAKLYQQQANVSDPRSVSPTHWIDLQKQLQAQEASVLERRNAAQTTRENRVPVGMRLRPDGQLERIPVVSTTKTSDDALTNDAWFSIINGKARPGSLPLGRDEGNKYREQLREKIASIASDIGLSPERLATLGPENKAKFGALAAVEKDLASIRPFDSMLDTNAKIAIDLAKKISGDRTNSQFINKPITWLEQNATDNPDIAEYLFQIQTVKTEGARILNNPRLVGQLTDSARNEMGMVVNGNMPLGQTERVLGRMMADGKNRVHAIEGESERLRTEIRGSAGSQPAAAPAASPAAPATAPKRIKFDAQGNQIP